MNDDKVVADLWAIESRLSASLEQFLTSDRVREAIVEYDIAHTRSFSSKEGALEGQLAPIKALVRDVVSDVTRQTKSLVNQFVERHTTWFEGNVISQVGYARGRRAFQRSARLRGESRQPALQRKRERLIGAVAECSNTTRGARRSEARGEGARRGGQEQREQAKDGGTEGERRGMGGRKADG